MQQNPSYGEKLENWHSYFSHSICTVFPSNSHPMVYFIACEMHGFPHQFSIARENATKPIAWGEHWKLLLVLFPYYGCFFSIMPHTMVYVITWEMHGFSHQFPIAWKNQQNSSNGASLGNESLYFFHSLDAFFIRFTSCGILRHM